MGFVKKHLPNMKKILFVRKFKKSSGGQIKVRDYFQHCLAHPDFEPAIYFTPDSKWHGTTFWEFLPPECVVENLRFGDYAGLFLAGRDWEFIPAPPQELPVINYIQHVKHAEPADKRFKHLRRLATRICVSEQVAQAISPFANGEVITIPNGISLEDFSPARQKTVGSILIWGRKNPALGERLQRFLCENGKHSELLLDYLPRTEFAKKLAHTDLLVALPDRTEGFYLPALEALASGCAVICSDAIGNRSFCLNEQTCLMPDFDDFKAHIVAVERLLGDVALKDRLRIAGTERAQAFSLASERKAFYTVLAKTLG